MTIFNSLHPYTIGYDDVFKHFESLLEHQVHNYPPYNIVKTGKNTYDIEVALAGFSKDDIEVEYAENMLTIKSKTEDKSNDADKDGVIHRGISKRYFSKAFTVADDVEVKGAELKDGLLRVSMERIIPEGKQARTIKVK